MSTLEVEKNYICEQDLLTGRGEQTQSRGGIPVIANAIRLLKIVILFDF